MSLHLPESTGCAREASDVSLAMPAARMATHNMLPRIQMMASEPAGERANVAEEALATFVACGITCAASAGSSSPAGALERARGDAGALAGLAAGGAPSRTCQAGKIAWSAGDPAAQARAAASSQ